MRIENGKFVAEEGDKAFGEVAVNLAAVTGPGREWWAQAGETSRKVKGVEKTLPCVQIWFRRDDGTKVNSGIEFTSSDLTASYTREVVDPTTKVATREVALMPCQLRIELAERMTAAERMQRFMDALNEGGNTHVWEPFVASVTKCTSSGTYTFATVCFKKRSQPAST